MSALAQSLDINSERLKQLRGLFPEAFTEGQINFKRLQAALGESVATGRENYELSWAGKADARAEIQKRTTATLRPDTANSVNWDATQNLYIEGENLEVLRTLQKAYFGKVKMIYIDPPYNTGNDSFVYPDDYSETLKEYQARTGQTDEAGFVNKQTLWKKNTKENGQFHSVWLSMMYPRLFLARNLLRDDGVIFVSIDDNEAADLKLLMDEVFGEDCFIAQFTREQIKGGSQSKFIRETHDYVMTYAKRTDKLVFSGYEKEAMRLNLTDSKGAYAKGRELNKWGAGSRRVDAPGMWYPIKGPNDEAVYPIRNDGSEGRWRLGKKKLFQMVEDEEVIFEKRDDGTYVVYEKLRGNKNDFVQFVSILKDKYINAKATEQLKTLFEHERAIFDFSKPYELIKDFLLLSNTDDESLVLDFFSGSGTTAQAVLELNEEDGGNRQFICVQMPEVLEEDSEAFKAGYRTIADIGRARIQKVIERMEAKRHEDSKQGQLVVSNETPPQALGFNAFKLGPSNFKEWRTNITEVDNLFAQLDDHIDSTRPDSIAGSMVYELLLKLALPITTPIEGHKVGNDATAAMVYLAKPDSGKHVAMFFEAPANHAGDVLAFILKAKPAKVLCLNKCFADSQALTNFSLQLQDADIALEVL